MRPPCIGKCPEIKINKNIKEIKQYTHTPSLFSGFVDGHSCWFESCFSLHRRQHWQHYQTSVHRTHILVTVKGSYAVSHIMFSYCTNTVLSLFTSQTPTLYTVKECSQTTTRLYFSLISSKCILWPVFSLLSLILCTRCIVHMHWIPSLHTSSSPSCLLELPVIL